VRTDVLGLANTFVRFLVKSLFSVISIPHLFVNYLFSDDIHVTRENIPYQKDGSFVKRFQRGCSYQSLVSHDTVHVSSLQNHSRDDWPFPLFKLSWPVLTTWRWHAWF